MRKGKLQATEVAQRGLKFMLAVQPAVMTGCRIPYEIMFCGAFLIDLSRISTSTVPAVTCQ